MKESYPPPWVKHPNIKRFSIGWRMEKGESYLEDWYNFFDNLDDENKQKYKKENPETFRWWGFYNLPSSSKIRQTEGILITFGIFCLSFFFNLLILPFKFIKEKINQ